MDVRRPWRTVERAGDRLVGVFAVDPSSGHSLPYVDGLRAVAVAFIVVLHSWQVSGATVLNVSLPGLPGSWNVGPAISSFQLGVPLFFVLSGFLLSQPFIRAHANGRPAPGLRRYFTLRAARIVPAYYFLLFCLLVLLTPVFLPPALVYSRVGVIAVVAHLLFLQEMVPVASSSFNADPVLWTLTMEVLFYISIPWAARAFYGRRWMVSLPLAAAISVGWLYLCWHGLGALVPGIQAQAAGIPALKGQLNATQSYLLLERQFPAHAVDFALGMTAANWYVRRREGQAGRAQAALCALVVLAGWALVLWVMVAASDFRLFWAPPTSTATSGAGPLHIAIAYYLREGLASLGFAMVLTGVAFGQRWLQAIYGLAPLRLLGNISYSIYLWHYVVLSMLIRWWPGAQVQPALESRAAVQAAALASFWHLLLAVWVIVVPLAAVVYLTIERPFLRLARRRRPSVAGARAAVPALHDRDTEPVPVPVAVLAPDARNTEPFPADPQGTVAAS